MAKIALLHGLHAHSRQTNQDFVLAFPKYVTGHKWTMVNVLGPISREVLAEEFDLVLMTYEFLSQRSGNHWKRILARVSPILRNSRLKAALPQDDYVNCEALDSMFELFGVDAVYSPLRRDHQLLFPRSSRAGTSFACILTGYFEPSHIHKWEHLKRPFIERDIDFGQRVRSVPPYLGIEAGRKSQLSIEFAARVSRSELKCDVSTSESKTLQGRDWFEFLGNLRFTMSHLGGASIADPKGNLRMRFDCVTRLNPRASEEEVRRQLKLHRYPQGDFTMITPRLFESAIMGTCQIMPEADYQVGLEPWEDYIPLSPDLANVDQVIGIMTNQQDLASGIADACLARIQQDPTIGYPVFARDLVRELIGDNSHHGGSPGAVEDPATDFVSFEGDWLQFLPYLQSEIRRLWVHGRIRAALDVLNASTSGWDRFLVRPELFELPQHRTLLRRWLQAVVEGDLPLDAVRERWVAASWLLNQFESGK